MQVENNLQLDATYYNEAGNKINTILRNADECLRLDSLLFPFAFESASAAIVSKIQQPENLNAIFYNRRFNPDLHMLLIYKVKDLATKLKNFQNQILSSDFQTIHSALTKIRVVNPKMALTGIEDLDCVIIRLMVKKSNGDLDTNAIRKLRSIVYQCIPEDAMIDSPANEEEKQAQANHKAFIQTIANQINSKYISDLNANLTDSELIHLCPLLTSEPLDSIVNTGLLRHCTNLTKFYADNPYHLNNISCPEKITHLTLNTKRSILTSHPRINDFTKVIDLVLKADAYNSVGLPNALPNLEKLKSIEIRGNFDLNNVDFWTRCSSLEKFSRFNADKKDNLRLIDLPFPEKIKSLEIDCYTEVKINGFINLRELWLTSSNLDESFNYFSNLSKLTQLSKFSLYYLYSQKNREYLFNACLDNIQSNKSLEIIHFIPYSESFEYAFDLNEEFAKKIICKFPLLSKLGFYKPNLSPEIKKLMSDKNICIIDCSDEIANAMQKLLGNR